MMTVGGSGVKKACNGGNVLPVAPKLTKTKPLVNFAKYFVDRQF
jgi:hypothetical protein